MSDARGWDKRLEEKPYDKSSKPAKARGEEDSKQGTPPAGAAPRRVRSYGQTLRLGDGGHVISYRRPTAAIVWFAQKLPPSDRTMMVMTT